MALVGDILSYSEGTWTPAPASFTQQWKRDGVDIAGATNTTYVLTPADLFAVISLEVTAYLNAEIFKTVPARNLVGVTEADEFFYDIVVQTDFKTHNNGTSFKDSGPWGRSVSGFGDASVVDQQLVLPDGNDYLLVPDHEDVELNGKFTLEWWDVEITTSGGRIAGQYQASYSQRGWIVSLGTTGGLALNTWSTGTTAGASVSATIPGVNVGSTIGHIRMCRDASNVVRMWADGVFIGSGVVATNTFNSNAQLGIGGTIDDSGTTGLLMLKGKIGAFRFTNEARNTTDDDFVAPGRPLPDTAPRVDPLATDEELQVLRIDATVAADQSPAAHPTTWNATSIVGSDIVFNGTSAYIEAPRHRDFCLWGDFTIRIDQVEFDNVGVAMVLVMRYGYYAGSGWIVRHQGDANVLRFYYGLTSSLVNLNVDAPWTPSVGVKYDIIIEREGTDLRMFVDGFMLAKHTVSGPIYHSRSKLRIGFREDTTAAAFAGKLQGVTITNGRALIANDDGYGVPYILSDPEVSVVSGPDPIAEGSVLSVTTGTWARSPDSYSYRWLRDDVAIAGATSSTYELVLADEGTVIKAEVTATNANGDGDPITVLAEVGAHR